MHEEVHRTESFHYCSDDALGLPCGCEVGRYVQYLPGCRSAGTPTRRDARALVREHACRFESDPARRAGNEADSVTQGEVHGAG